MIQLRSLLVLLVFLFSVPAVGAQQAQRTHDITIDDYFTQADIFGAKISPDGKYVVYVVGNWQKSANNRKTDLWLVSTKDKKARKLTFARANDRAPEWSPDSKHIYFLGNRQRGDKKDAPYNGKTQIWRLAAKGGTLFAVTREKDGVTQFALAPDGKSVYYIKSKEVVEDPWKALREKYKKINYGHGIVNVSQVWQLDLQTWRKKKVIDDKRVIHEMAVSPDGRRIAMITTSDGKVVSFEGKSRVDIYDRDTGKITSVPDKVFRKDVPSPYGWLESLAWSANSDRLAFNVIFDAYPSEVVVAQWVKETPKVFLMKRPKGVSLRGYGSPLAWRGEKPDLCFLGDVKGRTRLYCTQGVGHDSNPTHQVLTPGDVCVGSISFPRKGTRAALVMNDPHSFPEVYLLQGTETTRLSDANPQTATWKLPQMKIYRWKGADGTPVEGILELPPDYKQGQRVPLVVDIHGGPTTCAQFKLQYWIYGRTLLPAKGFAVLCPNYRGSTGYGDKFLTDLIGKENNIDVKDILAGVDALVKDGIADPERMAVSGWSNGGYLTNCIITKTNRFKAAISGAGIVDAIMEFGSNDEPAYAIVFKRGFPWNKAAKYHSASPTYQLNKIRTPTLIHVGGQDERCPPGHSRMLYRALKQYLHVPTELLVYPGAGHGLMTYNHRRAKMEWDLAWLNRYVLGKK